MKIIIFRHGEKQKLKVKVENHVDMRALTPQGIKQIQALSLELKNKYPELVGMNRMYSSSYTRSFHSAEIIRNSLNIENIFLRSELREFYPYTNLYSSKEERKLIMAKALLNPDTKFEESVETANEHFAKVLKLIDELKDHREQIVLLSAHGGIMRNFVYHIDEDIRPQCIEDAMEEAPNGCYSEIDYDNGKFKVIKYKKTSEFI